jgi:hypothetical protein
MVEWLNLTTLIDNTVFPIFQLLFVEELNMTTDIPVILEVTQLNSAIPEASTIPVALAIPMDSATQ